MADYIKINAEVDINTPKPNAEKETVGSFFKNLLKGLFFFAYYPMRSLLRYIAYAKPARNAVAVRSPESYHPVEGFMGVKSDKVITADNESIEIWHKISNKKAPTIIYCHGNATNLAGIGEVFSSMAKAGYNVVAFDYRGYGNSTGKPSEQGLYKDADAVMKWVSAQNIPNKDVIVIGESLGSGVATHIASKNKDIGAVVLKAPFSSLRDRVPALARPFAADDVFDSAAKIKNIKSPILIVHDTNDLVIGSHHSEKLLQEAGANGNVKYSNVSGYGHMIPSDVTLHEMAKFLPQSMQPYKTSYTDEFLGNLSQESQVERLQISKEQGSSYPSKSGS